MRTEQPPRYAARLNSFKVGAEAYWPGKNRVTTADLLERAATVDGLNAADLNYPDHFENTGPRRTRRRSRPARHRAERPGNALLLGL